MNKWDKEQDQSMDKHKKIKLKSDFKNFCDVMQKVIKINNTSTNSDANYRHKRAIQAKAQDLPDSKRTRMESSTQVQSYRHQCPIIDENASLSPVTLSGQDTTSGTLNKRDTSKSPTKILGGVMVLEITPAKSESGRLDGKIVLCQTRDLTRALTGRGMVSRASGT